MKYLVQYHEDGEWIPFMIKSCSIYEVEKWVVRNIQELGICISLAE